jgi:hypothetical protein
MCSSSSLKRDECKGQSGIVSFVVLEEGVWFILMNTTEPRGRGHSFGDHAGLFLGR